MRTVFLVIDRRQTNASERVVPGVAAGPGARAAGRRIAGRLAINLHRARPGFKMSQHFEFHP
jgi:hypothetical protein